MHRSGARALVLTGPDHQDDDDRDHDRAHRAAHHDEHPVAPAAAGRALALQPDPLPGRGPPGRLAHLAAGSWANSSLLHWGHRPNNSMVWSTAVKPASAATCSAQRSTARPSTSTLVPQLRQMR